MHLSILTSKPGRWVAVLAGIALAAYLASALFVIFISPPSVEQRDVRRFKRGLVEQLGREGIPKVIFVGGSATSFGVMPSVLKQQFGIESVNAGLNAGLGANFLLLWGCSLAESGDTLVFLIEPGLLRHPFDQPQAQSIAEMHMRLKYWNLKRELFRNDPRRIMPRIASLRSSGAGLTGLLGKLLRGQPLSGSWINHMDSYGTVTGTPALPGKLAPLTVGEAGDCFDFSLTEDGARALSWVAENCRRRGIRVCYIFPKIFVREDAIDVYNRQSSRLGSDIGRFMPVLNAGDIALTNANLYLDSVLHLNPEGAKRFSVEIAGFLQEFNLVPDGVNQ